MSITDKGITNVNILRNGVDVRKIKFEKQKKF